MFGNNSSSIPNTLWCLFWLSERVDKKSVHAKIKCNIFFSSLSLDSFSIYIVHSKIHPQHMNNMCFRKLKIKHIAFICSSSSSLLSSLSLSLLSTHMLLLCCCCCILLCSLFSFVRSECMQKTYIFASYQQSLVRSFDFQLTRLFSTWTLPKSVELIRVDFFVCVRRGD